MVGASDAFWLYQNSGPLLIFVLLSMMAYVWKFDLTPRLDALESTQEDRGDELQERALSAQERDILLDDAQSRIEQVEQAEQRLRKRLRAIEQAFAAEHGRDPVDDDWTATDGSGDRQRPSKPGDRTPGAGD